MRLNARKDLEFDAEIRTALSIRFYLLTHITCVVTVILYVIVGVPEIASV